MTCISVEQHAAPDRLYHQLTHVSKCVSLQTKHEPWSFYHISTLKVPTSSRVHENIKLAASHTYRCSDCLLPSILCCVRRCSRRQCRAAHLGNSELHKISNKHADIFWQQPERGKRKQQLMANHRAEAGSFDPGAGSSAQLERGHSLPGCCDEVRPNRNTTRRIPCATEPKHHESLLSKPNLQSREELVLVDGLRCLHIRTTKVSHASGEHAWGQSGSASQSY